jgi:cephalosporin hydroxylase
MWRNGIWSETRWLGARVLQWPTDLFAVQELLHTTRPDFVVETGAAAGGSALFYASIFELIGHGKVISVDVDMSMARQTLAQQRLADRITLIEGSSTAPEVIDQIKSLLGTESRAHFLLDSDHRAFHVKAELDLYSKMTKHGCYVVVFDTNIDDAPEWKGDNPLVAVNEFLKENSNFEVDKYWEKYQVTFCRSGFLKRI